MPLCVALLVATTTSVCFGSFVGSMVNVVSMSGMPLRCDEIVHLPSAVNVTTPFDSIGLPSASAATIFHSPANNFSSSFTALLGSSPDDAPTQSETAITQDNRRVIIERTSWVVRANNVFASLEGTRGDPDGANENAMRTEGAA